MSFRPRRYSRTAAGAPKRAAAVGRELSSLVPPAPFHQFRSSTSGRKIISSAQNEKRQRFLPFVRHFSRKTADLAARNEKDGVFFHLMRLALRKRAWIGRFLPSDEKTSFKIRLFPGRAENSLFLFVSGRHGNGYAERWRWGYFPSTSRSMAPTGASGGREGSMC